MSRAATGAPQPGHRERGRTIDSSRGRRWMQTLAKLPTTSPKAKAEAPQKGVASAGRSHGDVGIGDGIFPSGAVGVNPGPRSIMGGP